MKCHRCKHDSHVGGVCGYYITETLRDDVGIFHAPSYEEQTIIKDTCRCVAVGFNNKSTWIMEDLGQGRSISRSFGGSCATCDGGGCGDCK